MRKASKGKFNKAKKEAIGEREIFKEKTNFEGPPGNESPQESVLMILQFLRHQIPFFTVVCIFASPQGRD